MQKLVQWLAERRRALIATAVAIVVAVHEISVADTVTWYATVAVAVLGAIGVYLIPDLDPVTARWVKPAVATLMTASQAAVQAADGGITGYEWVSIAVAAAGALGIVVVPNRRPATYMPYVSKATEPYLGRRRSTG